jgi:hypothetical protein
MAVAANPLSRSCIRVVEDQVMRAGNRHQPSGQLLKIGFIPALLIAKTVDVNSNA